MLTDAREDLGALTGFDALQQLLQVAQPGVDERMGGVRAHEVPPWSAVSTASLNGFQVRLNATSASVPAPVSA